MHEAKLNHIIYQYLSVKYQTSLVSARFGRRRRRRRRVGSLTRSPTVVVVNFLMILVVGWGSVNVRGKVLRRG